MNDFFKGIRYVMSGFGLITKPGLRQFVLIPLMVNIILFSGAIWYGSHFFESLINRFIPDWLMWLEWILWPLFASAIFLFLFYGFTLVANLIAAPFNGLLAEKVQQQTSGVPIPDSTWADLVKDIVPAMLIEIKKLVYFVMWSVPFLILFFIPGPNIAAPFLWMAFSAWMLSLEYTEFSSSNNRMHFPQLRQQFKTRRMLAMGFGGMVLVCTLIPVLNFLIIPAAVSGGTRLWLEEMANK